MRPIARPRIERAAFRLLDASPLCAIATAAPRTTAHIHTAYFAWTGTSRSSGYPTPLREAFAQHPRSAEHGDHGLQLPSGLGATRPRHSALWIDASTPASEIAPADSLYAARFPGYATPDLRAYRFNRFRTERLKVFDEAVFGAGVFVTATIHSGQGPIWGRTDISSGAEAN